MDLPPQAEMPEPKHNLVRVAIGLVILAVLLVGIYMLSLYGYIHLGGSSVNGHILLTLSDEPNSGLYSIDTKNKTLKLFSSPSLPKGNITAAAFGTKYNYYFVTDPSTSHTHIYRENLQGSKSVEPVVSSNTFKFNVSYDPGSDTLAYLSINPTTVSTSTAKSTWDVVIVNPSSTAINKGTGEKTVAKGQNVSLLKGGLLALVEEGTNLVLVNTKTNASSTMLDIDFEAPLAVDAEAGTLALYNEKAHNIQYFNIKSAPTTSYVSSANLNNEVPQQMIYVNHQLLLAGIQDINKVPNLQLSFIGSQSPYARIPLAQSSTPVFIGPLLLEHD